MAVRRLNYTGRKRIERQRIDIEIIGADDGGVPSFTAVMDLEGLGLPSDARLIVEAKRERTSRRFEWGTVGNPYPPANCSLAGMPSNPGFRVMAVASDGTSRLLALADNIPPKREGADGSESLLWLEEAEIGQEVWRMDFGESGDNPKMLVNKSIPGISAAVRQDEAFRALVIPEALRAVLAHALIVDGYDFEDDQGIWSNWMGFVREFYAEEFPGASDDADGEAAAKTAWIEQAVEAFAEKRFHASDSYAATRGQ